MTLFAADITCKAIVDGVSSLEGDLDSFTDAAADKVIEALARKKR